MMERVRSRLASWLRPWLEEEPDLKLSLGFVRLNAMLRKLVVSPSVINSLIERSTRLVVKQARVREICLSISPWSSPAITVEITGIDITLAPRETAEEGGSTVADSAPTKMNDRLLAFIDPEGASLHDIVETIPKTASSGGWFAEAMKDAVLRHFQLRFQDMHFQLEFADESFAWSLKTNELHLEPQFLDRSSLLKGIICAFFVSGRESFVTATCTGLEFGLKLNDRVNCIASSKDLSTCIRLRKLQPLGFDIRIPLVESEFSPVYLPAFLAMLNVLSPEEVKVSRNGRGLWKIAAQRIKYLTLCHSMSLYNLVKIAVLWMRYVQTYEKLLLLVGYPNERIFSLSAARASKDTQFLKRVKHTLAVIDEMEKELPIESVARARRIARYQALLHSHNNDSRSHIGVHFSSIRKFFAFFTPIWKVFHILFHLVGQFLLFLFSALSLRWGTDTPSPSLCAVPFGDSSSHHSLCVHLEQLRFIISPGDAPHASENVSNDGGTKFPVLNLFSLCVATKSLCLSITADSTEQSLSLALGELQVHSYSLPRVPLTETDHGVEAHTSFRGGPGDGMQVILWSEPALLCRTLPGISGDSGNLTDRTQVLILENCLGQTLTDLKSFGQKFEGNNPRHMENPFVLCEIKSFFMSPYLTRSASGIWKCSLALGKLNFDLDYSSTVSVAVLFRQILYYLHLTASYGNGQVLLDPSSIRNEEMEVKWEDQLALYTRGMKLAMVNMIPEKNIQIGAVLAGPSIRILLQRGATTSENDANHIIAQGNGDSFLTVDLENIELAVWPASKDMLLKLNRVLTINETTPEYLWLKEPRTADIQEAESKESFISQGRITHNAYLKLNSLTAFFEDSEENQPPHVIGPVSMTVQSSTCRDYFSSFSTNVDALSMAVSGFAMGAAAISYMDELCFLFQVFEGMTSAACLAFDNSYSAAVVYPQQFIKRFITSNEKTTARLSAVEDKALNFRSTQFIYDASLEFMSVDIILDYSRKNHLKKNYNKYNGASSSSFHSLMAIGLPDFNMGVFLEKSCIQILWDGRRGEVLIDLSGIQAVVFKDQTEKGLCNDISAIKHLIYQSLNCLYEVSLASCMFSLYVGSHGIALPSASGSDAVDGSTSYKSTYSISAEKPQVTIFSEESEVQSSGTKLRQLHAISTPVSASDCWILIKIGLAEIFMAEYCLKNLLTRAHQPKRLQLFVCISRGFQTVDCDIQGGFVYFETTTLAMFIQCYRAYSLWITSLLLQMHDSLEKQCPEAGTRIVISQNVAKPSNHRDEDCTQGIFYPYSCSKACKWEFLKALTVNISQFSLFAAISDGCGGVQELTVEADINLNLTDFGRKFSFDLSRLTILSQHLYSSSLNKKSMSGTPHFHSNTISDMPFKAKFGLSNSILPAHIEHTDDEHSKHTPVFQRELFVESSSSGFLPLSPSSFILKHLTASILVEKTVRGGEVGPLQLKNYWAGDGSISGVDLTITISEVQMLLNLAVPFSGVSVKTGYTSKRSLVSSNEGGTNYPDYTIPDGAIVAIQDLHQHMYIAVEAVGKNYHLVGTLHYSLSGERALFRVKYHNRKRWWSPCSCFSLTSLHAKNDAGEPLRLNYRPGSSFVDISSSDDRDWALWQTTPYKPDNYGDDNDLECYVSTRKAFNLVNQKNDCSIAFVDGLPEFVKKPGNPFKAKVFQQHTLMRDAGRMDSPNPYLGGTRETDLQGDSTCIDEEMSGKPSKLPHVNIRIEKIIITVLHEVSDANDKFPLLRGCIDNVHIIEHVVPSKLRLISTFNVSVDYFDAQKNFWREFISPVDTCVFFRSKFMPQGSQNAQLGVPVRSHFRMSQVGISLTEHSLDILLFLVGKLDIAGPYAVRNSTIFANCCKVDNHTGLSLLCHFADNQDATVSGKESASVFLRHMPFADQSPEKERLVEVRLAEQGLFSTSPINISLSSACVLAWRTRVVSLQDTRTFPGPFVVVDVSKNVEDGLSLVVSPLLRIHNESGFSMELRFRRPQETEEESASILLKNGDIIDDSTAVFDALGYSGSTKKTLMSLALGNFLLSVRPEISEGFKKTGEPVSVDWSEDLKGGKAVRVSGIFDKLNYRLRKAFGVQSVKSFFSTIYCPLTVGGNVYDLHFLIQTIGREVPVMQPQNVGDASLSKNSPVAFQVQKEIFIFPTVRVSNLLQTELLVVLMESYPDVCTKDCDNTGKQAIIPCGSSACLYANPAIIFFAVTLTAYSSSCKPVNSGDWVKRLHKQKTEVHYIDIELVFDGGKYFALLRLSRGEKGILEATVYTPYTLQNNTELPLFCFASNRKPLSRAEFKKYSTNFPPEYGCLLPPKSTRSWFLKTNKVRLKRLEEKALEAILDLDLLSGFTELSLAIQSEAGINHIAKMGVSLKPCVFEVFVPSQIVSIVPRYVVSNESKETIIARQCYLEDDMEGITSIEGNQKAELHMRTSTSMRRGASLFDSIIRKHRNENEDTLAFIQFRLTESECTWSGPICMASLGRFFLKFKRQNMTQYASVHIEEENSSLVLHFHMPPHSTLPYRIENCLHNVSITYYQKDFVEPEVLASGNSVEYVWDDFNLPHKLVVQITDLHILREINIDKVCAWKPFSKTRHNKGMASRFPFEKVSGALRRNYSEARAFEVFNLGYEVYADGLTRVLRICEFADSYKEEKTLQPSSTFQFRVSCFVINLLENGKKDEDANECAIIAVRLTNIAVDSVITQQYTHNCMRVQLINVDEKWEGAPFASMVRRSQLYDLSLNESILHIVFILHSTNSSVKQVKYSSIVLQPIDLNLDEETLMRLAPFWRTSLNDSKTQSQLFYFKHFEIHPIKIRASFLPGSPYSSYSSAQEMLRTLLHSVIKVPAIKNTVVELNGILLTHALVTLRELFIKSAQHYSWYIIRAVYIAKGSPLLPPAFASIFDDSASSSLDVFFDPSDGSINLPGLTLGMFKFISKCIDSKGFSGTKRYFGDLGKTMKKAGSNAIFAAITEISDNVLKGAEASGINGLVTGFHQGLLKLAMEPSLLGAALMEGGPDRKIKLDRSPGVDELYIEGYLQAVLDVMYKQEYLQVRVTDSQVLLKNLPPNSSLINEIVEHVKSFLVSRALLNGGETSTTSLPLRHLRGESDWRIGPTVLTLCEHLFVSFAIRMLRKQASKLIAEVGWGRKSEDGGKDEASSLHASSKVSQEKTNSNRIWVVGKFVLSGMVAYVDGRLCRHIPHPIARRIVSGFLLSFLEKKEGE